jgi:large subunit ribosomal protein L25
LNRNVVTVKHFEAMKSVSLTAYPRTLTRRAGAKTLRAQDRVPAVIYGRHNPPQNLELKMKDIEKAIHHSVSENVLVDVAVDGDPRPKRLALVQEVQHHCLSGKVLHVDLHEVIETETVSITVPVETLGEAVGVKTGGGVLEHVLFKLKVRGLPKDLPESLQVDVSNLDIGKSIHLGEIQPPPGVEILGHKKVVVISVAAPLTEAQEAAVLAPVEGAAQPEMIKEKKEEGAAPTSAPAPAAGEKDKGAAKATDKGADKGAAKVADKAPDKAEKKAEKKK